VEASLGRHVPDLLINAAAYTKVDQAQAEPGFGEDTAYALNSPYAASKARMAFPRN
jgi:dTDP-4-dehydrorhamnose reductase